MPTSKVLDGKLTLSAAANQRLRAPKRRGMFRDLDAARAQLGLLTAADSSGQARIYWLIDLNTQVVEDARFLSFGSMASHPITDCWTDLVRGQSVEQACAMSLTEIEAQLRDDADTPAFGDAGTEPLAFISDLQDLAKAALPSVKLLPKPKEVERYQRKREQDWDDLDRAWLPLSLMKKVMKAQDAISALLGERFEQPIAWEVEGLHDDLKLVIDFTKGDGTTLVVEQRPTVIRMIEEVLRSSLHPAIVVEEAQA